MILAGVGGQGNVVSARVLAEAALSMRYDVKTSEVHGMAQRGGSVICMVRWSEMVHSPLIPKGTARFILAFEILEGPRYLEYLSEEGIAVVNSYRLDPLPVLRGDAVYPEKALEIIDSYAARTVVIDAREIAMKAGNARAAGSCLLGALSNFLEFPLETWEEAINGFVPLKARDVNLRAFKLGRESVIG